MRHTWDVQLHCVIYSHRPFGPRPISTTIRFAGKGIELLCAQLQRTSSRLAGCLCSASVAILTDCSFDHCHTLLGKHCRGQHLFYTAQKASDTSQDMADIQQTRHSRDVSILYTGCTAAQPKISGLLLSGSVPSRPEACTAQNVWDVSCQCILSCSRSTANYYQTR